MLLTLSFTVAMLALAVPLVALSRRWNVAYPVTLVAAGLVLGFIPGVPEIRLDPALVLVVFLPPLLYWESITAPVGEMRANAGHIWLLAIGLAVFTAAVIAITVHALIPGFNWPIALLLGAILAPTDELAAVAVLERLPLPRYLLAVIEGESLLNDGSALVLFGIAVSAIDAGSFNPWEQLGRGLFAVAGGTALGFLVAAFAIAGWRRFQDGELQRTISFIIPFVAYTPAQALGLSGVLATVTLGVVNNRYTPEVLTPSTRLQGAGYWETVVFLANVFLYLLLGLQLHRILTSVLHVYPLVALVGYAVLLNAVIIAVRFAWLVAQEYVPAIGGKTEHPEPNVRHALIVAWSGMRGAVSLAAALAIPASLAARNEPLSDLIAFLAFAVIVVTLVLGGLTLPFAAARLLREDDAEDRVARELTDASKAMRDAALRKIAALQKKGSIEAAQAEILRDLYAAMPDGGDRDDGLATLRHAERSIIAAQRAALIGLVREGRIDNTILRRFQRTLDLAHERLGLLPTAEDLNVEVAGE